MRRRVLQICVLALSAGAVLAVAGEVNTPPLLDGGSVYVHATPSLDKQGEPHVVGEVANRNRHSWLTVQFSCRTDNTVTDGRPSSSIPVTIRFNPPLPPGSAQKFDVRPDGSDEVQRLSRALEQYPQPYWWACDTVHASGEDVSHQVFTIGPQPSPGPRGYL